MNKADLIKRIVAERLLADPLADDESRGMGVCGCDVLVSSTSLEVDGEEVPWFLESETESVKKMKTYHVEGLEEEFSSIYETRPPVKRLLADGVNEVRIFLNGEICCTVTLMQREPVYKCFYPAYGQ